MLLLRWVGYLRRPADDACVQMGSGKRVRILGTENFGVVFGVMFDAANLDDSGVSDVAAELLPVFSTQAEQCGLSLLRIEATRPVPGAGFIRRPAGKTHVYERQADGSWTLTAPS